VEPTGRHDFSLPATAVPALEDARRIRLQSDTRRIRLQSDTRTDRRQHRRALLPCEACGNDHTVRMLGAAHARAGDPLAATSSEGVTSKDHVTS
jgi:hypothetical protein